MAAIPSNIQSRIIQIRQWHSGIADTLLKILQVTGGPNYSYETAWSGNIKLFNNLLTLFEQFLYDIETARVQELIEEGEFQTALSSFDATVSELTADTQLQLIDEGVTGEFLNTAGNTYPIKYRAKIDVILAEAGLQPAAPQGVGEFIPVTTSPSKSFSNTGSFGGGSS